jgi:hypothetical protein
MRHINKKSYGKTYFGPRSANSCPTLNENTII